MLSSWPPLSIFLVRKEQHKRAAEILKVPSDSEYHHAGTSNPSRSDGPKLTPGAWYRAMDGGSGDDSGGGESEKHRNALGFIGVFLKAVYGPEL